MDASDHSAPRVAAQRGDPALDAAHEIDEGRTVSIWKQIQFLLHGSPTLVPFIVLLLAILLFSLVVGSRFFDPFNLSLVLQQVSIIAVVGIAQTLVILTAGIDLSVGAIMVLSSVVMGRLAVLDGVPAELALLLGLCIGAIGGFINGALVTYLRLPPFIVTLGTWHIFGALNLWYSRSETLRQQEVAATAPFLQYMATTLKYGAARLTYGSIMMVLIALMVSYFLSRTAFGRHIYATGDEPNSARLAGIRTDRTIRAVYTLAGLISALAAWVLIGRIGAISAISGSTANLDSITAAVIGGASLFGGRGSIIGTLIGALVVGVFRNGLALAGAGAVWQDFTVGSLIIVAVAIDQWIRKISA